MAMNVDRKLRIALALLLVLLSILILAGLVFVADSGLSLWTRLQEQSVLMRFSILGGFFVIGVLFAWILWKALAPRKPPKATVSEVLTEQDIVAQLDTAEAQGIDIREVSRELRELSKRRVQGLLSIAVMGEVSTGKSTLIRGLVPDAEVDVSVVGGSTFEARHYRWQSPDGDEVVVTDLPGLNYGESQQDVTEEAIRAHIVVFVCQGDLTRSEYDALKVLSGADKPLVLALNKTDLYTDKDLKLVETRLRERLATLFPSKTSMVTQIQTDTQQLDELRIAMQRLLRLDANLLERLRDSAVFGLASLKLEQAKSEYAYEKGQKLVVRYTRRAIVGALAAVAPGTDILIQGYLGTNLVRELCQLYEAPVQDLDIKRFLEICEQHIGNATPMVLAIAGNGFKAFPGIGTLAGGLIHAAAYGLIFDSMGNSLLETLNGRGTLQTLQATALFKEKLSEDLEKRSANFAKMVLDQRKEPTEP